MVKTPDLDSWDKWTNFGTVQVFSDISEFIARAKTSKDFTNPTPPVQLTLGYAPLSSQKFLNLPPIAMMQLQQFFPFFFMIIFWIPLYYLTSKIASEKESKAREGMKMMGLLDSSYLLSWFIVFLAISCLSSLVSTLIACFGVFDSINPLLFFLFASLYSITLYGEAFLVVSILPTKRSSGISVSLFHIISFYLAQLIADPNTASSTQYLMSLLPNVCMNQIIKQLFFFNFNTKEGLTFSSMSVEYQNYSFLGGMGMLLLDLILWTIIGLYCD
jgi:ATP-binding cassette subfamily A (ABC1) protein 3